MHRRLASDELAGVFPVVATPFRADGQPDLSDLRRIVEWLVNVGVDGVVFPGVASEFDQLTAVERDILVRTVGLALGGRAAFVVGASAPIAAAAAAFARAGREVGANAAMVMAPGSLAMDEAGLLRFYREVAETGIPIMLQNAPPPAGAGLDVAVIARVVQAVPQIRHVKEETMPCGQRIGALLAQAPPNLTGVFGGAGARYLIDELRRGAIGTMPACELADIHVALMQAWRAGDRTRARTLYSRSLPLLNFQAVFRMAMTKEVLRRRGIIQSYGVRAPGPRLDVGDHTELTELLAEAADLLAPVHQVSD